MALESRLKLSVDNFNPQTDLIEVFSKKAGVVGVITPSQISSGGSVAAGTLSTPLALSATLQRVQDQAATQSPLRVSTVDITNYGAGNVTSNTAFGSGALTSNISSIELTAFGINALQNAAANGNTGIGAYAGAGITTGTFNTVVGRLAGNVLASGGSNVAIGHNCMNNSTASNNTGVGKDALNLNVSGTGLTAIGYQALKNNLTDYNTAVGQQALTLNTSGHSNTSIGFQSMSANLTGHSNTVVGWGGGNMNTSGIRNNLFGEGQQTGNFSQVSMIGIEDTATGNNQMRFGSSSYNNGAVTTEAVVSDRTWTVFINGVSYKILLKA